MDRLNLLESRIRQLSCKLDLDVGVGKAGAGRSYGTTTQLGLGSSSSTAPPPVEDPAWADTAPMMLEPCRDPVSAECAPASKPGAAVVAVDGSCSAVEILQRGARQLHGGGGGAGRP
ncbi:hypothetical protein BAE44_0025856 [Dichanthelium oligosanthes]|uniref:Uncharacterized protein n=1 Tax=Dichanthelium oligosanthes TaxID=888268 RepID=A0A1E5UK08_9POAL|nr:hypothetical protein BAE44_0025856 [Dichanthelium oligosanthes]